LSVVSFICQIKVLFVDVPRSISIPPSCDGVPVSLLFNVIVLSARLIVSVLTVVVVPLTVKLPEIVKLFPIVTSSGKPKVNVPELSPTSISFAVPEKVIVPPNDVAVDVVPSVTVIEELINLALATVPSTN
jgi:hypothetical protein